MTSKRISYVEWYRRYGGSQPEVRLEPMTVAEALAAGIGGADKEVALILKMIRGDEYMIVAVPFDLLQKVCGARPPWLEGLWIELIVGGLIPRR